MASDSLPALPALTALTALTVMMLHASSHAQPVMRGPGDRVDARYGLGLWDSMCALRVEAMGHQMHAAALGCEAADACCSHRPCDSTCMPLTRAKAKGGASWVMGGPCPRTPSAHL